LQQLKRIQADQLGGVNRQPGKIIPHNEKEKRAGEGHVMPGEARSLNCGKFKKNQQ